MAVYYVLVALPVFYFVFAQVANLYDIERRKKQVITVFFVGYILLLCLRDKSVGIDLRNYIPQFEYVCNLKWKELNEYIIFRNTEPGYIILVKLISCLTDNPQCFLTLLAALTVVPVMLLYRKEADDSLLCISLFLVTPLFPMFFSGLRQSLAIAVIALAYRYVREKKLLSFAVCVMVATLFHISALIALGIYPLYHIRITKKWFFGIVSVLLVIFLFRQPVFKFFLQFAGDKYVGRYAQWNDTGAYTTLILYVMFSTMSFVFINDDEVGDEVRGLRNLLLAATCLQIFASIHPLAMRLNYYYILFIPVSMTKIISCRNRGIEQVANLAHIVMIIFFFVYFFLSAESGDTLQIFKYRFFF